MTTFIGLDLAWTSHRETWICWFEGDELDTLMCVRLEAAACRAEDLGRGSRADCRCRRRAFDCYAQALGRARDRPTLRALQGVRPLREPRPSPANGAHRRDGSRAGPRAAGHRARPDCPARPKRPERAYMDIVKNIQRTHEMLTPAGPVGPRRPQDHFFVVIECQRPVRVCLPRGRRQLHEAQLGTQTRNVPQNGRLNTLPSPPYRTTE